MSSPTQDGPLFRLLFAPQSAWPVAIVRILIGTVLCAWAISMMFDVSTLLAPDGPLPTGLGSPLLRPFELGTTQQVWAALVLLALVSIPIIVGFRPTVFLLIAVVLLVSVNRRAPNIVNSGDLILRNLTLLLAFTPSSAALSVDRWRTHGRAGLQTAPQIAPWGMRLIQLQVMCVYFIAFFSKSGSLWDDGIAVSTALRINVIQRVAAPDWLVESVPVIAALTWGTLVVELALALLLWNTRARPLMIVLALALHLSIDVFMLVGFFGPTMMAAVMIFLNGDKIQQRVAKRFARQGAAQEKTAIASA